MMLICVGVMLLVSGIVIVDRHRAKAMAARRLLATPQAAIANATRDGALRVEGAVVPSEGGTLVAPCSGRSVVWFRVRLRRMVGGTGGSGEGGGGELWATVAEECDGKPFLVDDGSGTRALVRRVNRALISHASRFERMSADAWERAHAFLALRGYADSTGIFEEECLASGD